MVVILMETPDQWNEINQARDDDSTLLTSVGLNDGESVGLKLLQIHTKRRHDNESDDFF